MEEIILCVQSSVLLVFVAGSVSSSCVVKIPVFSSFFFPTNPDLVIKPMFNFQNKVMSNSKVEIK